MGMKMAEKVIEKKDPVVAALLGIIPLFFMFAGMGQVYAGRLRRGLVILLVGWGFGVLNVIGILTVVGACFTVPATLIFIAWQAWDAYKCAQEFNEIAERR